MKTRRSEERKNDECKTGNKKGRKGRTEEGKRSDQEERKEVNKIIGEKGSYRRKK